MRERTNNMRFTGAEPALGALHQLSGCHHEQEHLSAEAGGGTAGGESSQDDSSVPSGMRFPNLLGRLRSYFSHPNKALRVARITWWGGFCGVPLLWLLNWLNFRKAVQRPDALTELKLLVRMSLILFNLTFALFVMWLVYFQTVIDTLRCPCDGLFGSDWRSSACPSPHLLHPPIERLCDNAFAWTIW